MKDIKRKDIRVSRDAVTGALESVVLDDVQVAYEKCIRFVEAQMLKLECAPHRWKLAEKIAERMKQMQPHQDGEGGTSLDRAEAALKAERGGK